MPKISQTPTTAKYRPSPECPFVCWSVKDTPTIAYKVLGTAILLFIVIVKLRVLTQRPAPAFLVSSKT